MVILIFAGKLIGNCIWGVGNWIIKGRDWSIYIYIYVHIGYGSVWRWETMINGFTVASYFQTNPHDKATLFLWGVLIHTQKNDLRNLSIFEKTQVIYELEPNRLIWFHRPFYGLFFWDLRWRVCNDWQRLIPDLGWWQGDGKHDCFTHCNFTW
jgi:hypothetical protein